MNRLEMEQLNGILKGKNEDIFLLEKYKEQLTKQESDFAQIMTGDYIVAGCIRIIQHSKRRVEEVQVKDTRIEVSKFLGRFD